MKESDFFDELYLIRHMREREVYVYDRALMAKIDQYGYLVLEDGRHMCTGIITHISEDGVIFDEHDNIYVPMDGVTINNICPKPHIEDREYAQEPI